MCFVHLVLCTLTLYNLQLLEFHFQGRKGSIQTFQTKNPVLFRFVRIVRIKSFIPTELTAETTLVENLVDYKYVVGDYP